jgi:1-phosphofructokinase family hexose kinase
MIGTITLNPSIDQNLIVRHLVKDDANRATQIFRTPGGKGVNVSKVVKELGGQTRAYVMAGGLEGEQWKKLTRKLRIDFDVFPVKGDTRVNTVLTDLEDHSQTRISAPGPRLSKAEIDLFLKRLLRVKPKPFLWALGGSLPEGTPASTYQKIILALQKNGVPCVLDTDNEALRLGIRARPFMIKPNEHEIQRLVNRSLKSIDDYLSVSKKLVQKGVKVVIVSLGRKGALFVTAEKAFLVSTPQVPVRSKVGAGDSLIGGFALGLQRKMSLEEAARLGVAASTSAVMREAPRLCLRLDISPLLGRIAIMRLC